MAVADFHFWQGLNEVRGLSVAQAAPIVADTTAAILNRRRAPLPLGGWATGSGAWRLRRYLRTNL